MEVTMKNITLKYVALIGVFSLAGCSSTSWVNEDNSVATDNKVSAAKLKCEVDDKIYNWMNSNSIRSMLISMQKTDAEKQKMKNHYMEQEESIYKEIETCMNKEGLKKK